MLQKLKNTNFIRWTAVILVIALIAGGIGTMWNYNSLEVQAANDTFPGVSELRSDVILGSSSYYILEIVDDYADAELGYYISGCEPFDCLWDKDSRQYRAWYEVLTEFETAQERKDFMNQLKTEVDTLVAEYTAKGVTAPFGWEGGEYTEAGVTAATDGAMTLTQAESSVQYGYMDYWESGHVSDGTNYWQTTFSRVTDLSVDTVNSTYTTTPYYLAQPSANATEYTYGTLAAAAADSSKASLVLCRADAEHPGYYEYVGTIAEVWQGIVDVSGGDVLDKTEGLSAQLTGYYDADFVLLTNQIDASCQYLYTETDTYAVDANGNPNGNSSLVAVAAGQTGVPYTYHTVPAQTFYFTGYPNNTEVFRGEVLALEEDEYDYFPVNILVMTPKDLNEEWVDGYLDDLLNYCGMVYVNATGAGAGGDIVSSGDAASSVDLSTNPSPLDQLETWIVDNQIPCLFNLDGIMRYQSSSGAETGSYAAENCGDNIGALAAYLMSADLSRDTNHDCNFVRDNVWFFRSTDHQFIRSSLKDAAYNTAFTTTTEDTPDVDFGQVLTEINLENQYRAADSGYTGGMLPTDIYDSTVWAYLINYSEGRVQITKSSLTILEIQPAASSGGTYTDSTFENGSKSKISKLSGVPENNITIVKMSMNEFVGRIEDLNATYDMIYFGSSMQGLNTTNDSASGLLRTNYNDDNMDGLLYSHVGDIVRMKENLSGLMEGWGYVLDDRTKRITFEKQWWTSEGSYGVHKEDSRYSGNDLTVDKYNALLDYVAASYPILVDSDLLTSSSNGTTKVNEYLVDNSSYLYEFLGTVIGKANVFSWSTETNSEGLTDSTVGDTFKFYADRPKLSLIANETYQSYIMSNNMYNENVTMISAESDGNYYLSYQFQIQNEGAANYDESYVCSLYIDINADGKFSDVNEKLTGVQVWDANGNSVSTSSLKADTWYTVKCEMPSGYSGCITWSLEVAQSSNSEIRTSVSGYTKLDGLEPAEIKILQVYYNSSSINLQKLIGEWNGSAYENYANVKNNYYHEYAEEIKGDYILDITTIARSVFETELTNDTIDMDDYDMLILGFSDAAQGVDWGENAIAAIRDFINSGKSVLFSHDMTSFTNIETKSGSSITYKDGSTSYNWNYKINTYIRDLVGMDTYGITYQDLYSSSPYALLKYGATLTLNAQNTYGTSLVSGTTISAPAKDANGYYELGVKDVAFKPRSDRKTTVAETQGYTASALNQYSNRSQVSTKDDSMSKNDAYPFTYSLTYRSGMSSLDSNQLTTKASVVNKGQITNYPFVINDTITVGSTHGQYYTLDLDSDADEDGESDLVVWYTLTDGEFDKSYKDVKNNYYIYNKGNITYTGMGHKAQDLYSNNSNIGNVVTASEAQLFLNTMIASYNSGTRKPDINLTDGETIYHYYDELTGSTAEDVDVYFTINDQNISMGTKTLTVQFFAEDNTNGVMNLLFDTTDPDSGYVDADAMLRNVTGELKVYRADTNAEVTDLTQLKPDVEYYVTVPASYLTDDNGYASQFYIAAKTTIDRTGSNNETVTPWAAIEVEYINVELFDLD